LKSHLSWFNSSWQRSTRQLLTRSPHGGMGERIRTVKVRKLVSWDKDSWRGKAKSVRTS